MEYLKLMASYIWIHAKDEGQLSKNSIRMWSRKITCSEILKHGAAEDRARLSPSSVHNKLDGRKQHE